MHVDLFIDHDSLARVDAALADREMRAKHVTPALSEIADDFLRIQQDRFHGRAGWKPLSPEWAVRKAAGGRSPEPLAGGDLERSLTHKGTRFSIRRTSGSAITLGTSDPVAHLHRDGTRRLPRRPPVSVSRTDEKRWADIFRRHLAGVPVAGRGL